MISVADFGRLRIEDYRLDDRVGCSDDWRFLGRVWHSWGHGHTDFLSTPDQPDVTRCICLDFADLPPRTLNRLLTDVGLALSPGMRLAEVQAVLGAPVSLHAGRASYEFQVGDYTVQATIQHETGLTHLVIYPPLPPL
jgi:hypothetical protein